MLGQLFLLKKKKKIRILTFKARVMKFKLFTWCKMYADYVGVSLNLIDLLRDKFYLLLISKSLQVSQR